MPNTLHIQLLFLQQHQTVNTISSIKDEETEVQRSWTFTDFTVTQVGLVPMTILFQLLDHCHLSPTTYIYLYSRSRYYPTFSMKLSQLFLAEFLQIFLSYRSHYQYQTNIPTSNHSLFCTTCLEPVCVTGLPDRKYCICEKITGDSWK